MAALLKVEVTWWWVVVLPARNSNSSHRLISSNTTYPEHWPHTHLIVKTLRCRPPVWRIAITDYHCNGPLIWCATTFVAFPSRSQHVMEDKMRRAHCAWHVNGMANTMVFAEHLHSDRHTWHSSHEIGSTHSRGLHVRAVFGKMVFPPQKCNIFLWQVIDHSSKQLTN